MTVTIDHPQIRSHGTCPLCMRAKDKGLVTCWSCYRAYGLRNGNPKIAAKLDGVEAALAEAVVKGAASKFEAASPTKSLGAFYIIAPGVSDTTEFHCKKCKRAWRVPNDKLGTFNPLELFDHAYWHSAGN